MTQNQGKHAVVDVINRKPKGKPEANLPSHSKARLVALIEEAVVDAAVTKNKRAASLR